MVRKSLLHKAFRRFHDVSWQFELQRQTGQNPMPASISAKKMLITQTIC
jgi:hypothetical protein